MSHVDDSDEPPILRPWREAGRVIDVEAGGAPRRLFLRELGEGPPLLLLHGFPAGSWNWRLVIDALAERSRVLAPDLLGFGYSAKPPRADYRIVAQAELIAALLVRLDVRECHVLAHAYGCSVAQELLARQRDGAPGPAIRSAAFLNGGLFPADNRPLPAQRFLFSPLGQFLAPVLPFPYRSFRRNLLRSFGHRRPPTEDELRASFHLLTRGGGKRVVRHTIRYMLERDERSERWVGALEHARDAGIPLCFIIGPDDPISGTQGAAWAAALPEAELIELDADVGHHPQLEDPDAVLRAYRRWRSGI